MTALATKVGNSPLWAKVVGAVLAAAVLVAIGASTAGTKTRIVTVTKTRDVVPPAVSSQLDAAHQRIGQLEDEASAVAQQKRQLDAQAQTLTDQKAQLDQRQQQLDQRGQQLDQRQAAANASSFSDGLYQVGKDIQPGRYHSAGASGASGNCYWAKLRSSDTGGIIDNNNSTGPQTVVIDSAYFTSNGCGAWTKVG